MNKIKVLHIAKIDNSEGKGTSVAVPQYIISQSNNSHLRVAFLNCSNEIITKLKNNDCYSITDNDNMRVLKKIKPDIVVFHELYKVEYIKIYKYLVKNNIPYIIIPHGGMNEAVQNTRKIKKLLGNILLFNDFFRKAKYIQYLSYAEMEKSKYKDLKYCIIGNGIENIPNENLYKNKHITTENLNLVYIGRYDYLIKGIDQLLDAFKRLKELNKNNIKLNLYGVSTNNEFEKIKNYIALNDLQDYINLNDAIYGDVKRTILLNNDVFIQVSRTEGQPLGVMEALSIGMPVILSEGTGFKKIIEDNDIGFSTKTDGKEILDAILKIENNKSKLDYYSNNSYSYAKKNYTWEENVNKTIKIYIEILRDKGEQTHE